MERITISENILLFICGAGVVQALILSGLIFFHRKTDKSVAPYLALYITCLLTPMIFPFLRNFFPWQTSMFIAPFSLLPGPFLYLYVRSFKERITWKKAFPHFIIFIVYFFIITGISVFIGRHFPPEKSFPEAVIYSPFMIIPVTIRMGQMFFYYFLSRKTLKRYQRSIQQLFSETSHIDLRWIKWLITGFLIMATATIALYSLFLWYPQYNNIFILMNAAIFTPYIYMATIKGITQPTLWQEQPGMNKEKVETEIRQAEEIDIEMQKETPKIRKSSMDVQKIQNIVSRINIMMADEKLFQETELTLQNLSERLEVPSYQVSQAINEGLKKNFYDLVNGHRVEEAKRLLSDERCRNYTILAIGFESGFNSKTTFNTVFKKFTGLTPTEFRNTQKASPVHA